MRINLKSTASAIGLFVLLTVAVDASLDSDPDDMHWPTTSAQMTTGDTAPHSMADVTDTLLD